MREAKIVNPIVRPRPAQSTATSAIVTIFVPSATIIAAVNLSGLNHHGKQELGQSDWT
jgi:hypothetical protein